MNENTPISPNRILVGDVHERLKELPDASVDCVITSPPYWNLRDYGHAAQIGGEATVDEWAETIADVCDELARVLKPTGALWLNLGDGYARHPREGAAKKSLLLGPERVALGLTESGWLLRNKVIWHKKNPMPSSVTDRLTTSHEYMYFFTRQPKYFFDLDVIREPATTLTHQGRRSRAIYPPREAVPSLGGGSSPRVDLNQGLSMLKAMGQESHPLGKNPGDCWEIATASYRGAHFATFPVELVRRPLLATCPERVCVQCEEPWRRRAQIRAGRTLRIGPLKPNCGCGADWRRGIVLDPFMGAGTVAVAAETHGRDWVGCELNPEYAALAMERIAAARARRGDGGTATNRPA